MKRLSVAVGLIALGAVCSLVGCKASKVVPDGALKMFGGPGDSPVVVRGGAMTVRTKDTTKGWQPANNGYCTGIGLTGSTLYFNYDFLGAATGYSTPPPSPIALTGNWRVTIVGRNYVPKTTPTPSKNGIVIAPVASCTGATPASVYVQMNLTGPNPGFYDSDADGVSAIVTGKRFRDLTPYGTSGTNCFGPNTSAIQPGDEDACERASLVTIQTASGGPYSGWCTNGECVIGLGDKQ